MAVKSAVKFTLSAEDRTKKAFDSALRGIDGLNRSVLKMGGLITGMLGAGGAAGFGALIKKAADTGDAFNKMSLRTGVSADELSALGFAAERSGTTLDAVEKSLKYLSKQMFDVSRGMGMSKQTFDALGISVVTTDGKLRGTTSVLTEVAGKLAAMDDPTRQVAYAMDIFGAKAGPSLLPLLKEGEAGILALTDRARELGIVMSDEDAKKAAVFTDALTDLKSSLMGITQTVSLSLMPTLTDLTLKTTDWVVANKDIIATKVDEFMDKVGKALEWTWTHKDDILAVFNAAVFAVVTIEVVALGKALWTVAGAFAAISTNPVALALIGFGGMAYGIYGLEKRRNTNNGSLIGQFASRTNGYSFGGGYAGSSGVSADFSLGVTPKSTTSPKHSGGGGTGTKELTEEDIQKYNWLTGQAVFGQSLSQMSSFAISGRASVRESIAGLPDVGQDTFDEITDASDAAVAEINGGWMSLSNDMSNIIANLGETGAITFNNLAGAFGDMLTKMATMLAAKSAVFGIFSILGGGNLLGGSLSQFLFPEFRAGGGPVRSGYPYVVGERGPELFVPDHHGVVIPNRQMSYTDNSTVSISFTAAEKEAMMREGDDQLARRIERVIRDRRVKLAFAAGA